MVDADVVYAIDGNNAKSVEEKYLDKFNQLAEEHFYLEFTDTERYDMCGISSDENGDYADDAEDELQRIIEYDCPYDWEVLQCTDEEWDDYDHISL